MLFEQIVGEGMSEGYTGQYVRLRARAEPGQIAPAVIESAVDTLALGTVIEN